MSCTLWPWGDLIKETLKSGSLKKWRAKRVQCASDIPPNSSHLAFDDLNGNTVAMIYTIYSTVNTAVVHFPTTAGKTINNILYPTLN